MSGHTRPNRCLLEAGGAFVLTSNKTIRVDTPTHWDSGAHPLELREADQPGSAFFDMTKLSSAYEKFKPTIR
jgi:hypothetical protein